jgi:hypothetical protein
MKKCFFLLSIILIVILIYSGTKVTKKSYLVLGIDSNLDYINDKKSNLEKNNKLLNFNTKYVNKNYRITDIINDIKFKKEIDNKTILNYIIKADYITVNVGYNDLKSIINESEIYLYDDIDSIIIDLDELFKLLRTYSKEKIEFIKIETDSNIDDYVNSRVEKLCNKYNIIYIY